MNFKFRPMTKADRAFMVEMLYEATIASGQTFDKDNVENDPHSFAYIKDFPKSKELGVIAETEDAVPVGAAWLRYFPNDDKPGVSAPELTIAIAPAYRSRGLAKKIMAELYAAAKRQNITVLKLGVHQENVAAVEFYKNDGWEFDVAFGEYLMMKRRL